MNGFWKGFKKGFRSLGLQISTLVNSVLLLIVYIIGIGITSVIARLFGKRFLSIAISKRRKSYWENLGLKRKELEDYYRQF